MLKFICSYRELFCYLREIRKTLFDISFKEQEDIPFPKFTLLEVLACSGLGALKFTAIKFTYEGFKWRKQIQDIAKLFPKDNNFGN